MEHVPLLVWRPWGAPDPGLPGTPTRTPVPTPIPEILATIAARTPHNYWLIFNECEHQLQCRTDPVEAAISYHDLIVPFLNSVDPQAELIVGGVNAHECGIKWLEDFMIYYRQNYGEPPFLAGWHFHLYPDVVALDWITQGTEGCDSNWGYYDDRVNTVDEAWAAWQADVYNIWAFVGQYGDIVEDEIWISEMGCLNPGGHDLPGPICGQEGYMYEYTRRITTWLNTAGRWVDRYAWFTDIAAAEVEYWDYTRLYYRQLVGTPTPTIPPGGPTPTPGYGFSALGNFYGGVTPAAAVDITRRVYLPVVSRDD